MNIGILTLHSGANYGGTLQCVALYNLLKECGYDVEVIDFKPTLTASLFKRIFYKVCSVRSISDVKKLVFGKKDCRKAINTDLIKVFDTYRKSRLTFSEKCDEYSISAVANQYDAIVVGSDQVWSSTVRTHLTYMGDWLPPYKGKLFSYAACAVTMKYPIVRKSKIKGLLSKFEILSVRDDVSKNFVKHFLPNRNVQIDFDPTLLYSFEKDLPAFESSEKYILVYVLGNEIAGGNRKAIDKIKQLVGDITVIAVTVYDEEVDYANVTIKNASPSDWLNYIRNACFVFTDSFHGEVFSIRFKKQFCVYYVEENRASRIIALSKMFHIENRVITNADDIERKNYQEPEFFNYEKQKKISLSYINHIMK